jgi:hypothetical protein
VGKNIFKHRVALVVSVALNLMWVAFFTTQPVSACGITEGFATDTNTGQMLCSFIEPANQLQQDLRGWVFDKSQEGFLIVGGSVGEISTSAWVNILVVANILLAVAFLVVIYGFVTNTSSARIGYSIKKTLPRLVLGAIVINVSFYAVLLMVDLSSIIGVGANRLIVGSGDSTITVSTLRSKTDCESHELVWRSNQCYMEASSAPPNPAIEGAALTLVLPSANADERVRKFLSNGDSMAAVEMNSGSLAIGWLLTVALVVVNLSYIGLLMLFTFRQIAIIALAVVSSVAFCSLALFSTKKFFWGWLDFLVRTILIAPVYVLAQTFVFFVADAIPSGRNDGVGIVEIVAEATAALLITAVCVLCFVKSKGIIQKTGKLLTNIRENAVSRGVLKETSKTTESNHKKQLAEETKTRSDVFKLDEKNIKSTQTAVLGAKRLWPRRRIGNFNIDKASLNIRNSTIAQPHPTVDEHRTGNVYNLNNQNNQNVDDIANRNSQNIVSSQQNKIAKTSNNAVNIDRRVHSQSLDRMLSSVTPPSITKKPSAVNQNTDISRNIKFNSTNHSEQTSRISNRSQQSNQRNSTSNYFEKSGQQNSTTNYFEKPNRHNLIDKPVAGQAQKNEVNAAREKFSRSLEKDSNKKSVGESRDFQLNENHLKSVNFGKIGGNPVDDSDESKQKRDQKEFNSAISPNQLTQQIRNRHNEDSEQ